MLVLSRLTNEWIVIEVGNRVVWVKVCEASNGRAKLGIEAPHDVKVHRDEVYEQILKQREAKK